ncbi:MAG: HDIG domain-containing protein, partial [Deltaproteobacteria bacterium]|nr:HDIG domain-containing protein [Deltaproteobacteria bacterium]
LKNIAPTYDFYPSKGMELAERFRHAFAEARKAGAEVHGSITPDELMRLRIAWEDTAGLKLTDAQWQALASEQWGFALQELLANHVVRIMSRPIVADTESLGAYKEKGVVMRQMSGPDAADVAEERVWKAKELQSILSLDAARREVKSRVIRDRLRRGVQADTLLGIVAQGIQPNCSPNLLASEMRRNQAVREVPERTRIVQAGEIIARRGEPYTAEKIFLLEGIRKQKATAAPPIKLVGHALVVGLLLALSHHFGRRFFRTYAPSRMDLLCLCSILVLLIVISRGGILLGDLMADALPIGVPRFAFGYVLPVAAGAMLVAFLLGAETALGLCFVAAVLLGLTTLHDSSFTAFAIVSSLAGAAAVAHADKRAAIIRAGILTGLVNVVAALGLLLMRVDTMADGITFATMAWYAAAAFMGGLMSAIVVLAVTPVFESLFGYTTDIKLLELANLNHPLLRDLIIRAPGTYHHSHLVGILAEAAAQGIGANPLLARVAAYYHDIGKMRKPLYFTENVKEGESRHERLTPHMSALIISSHIKEGLDLAKAYKLPEKIAAMIPQHHGTNRIGYFYERAKEAADPALGEVDEKDYRYPGPKPQSREAGILMLADQSEGAIRALKEKTPARVQQTVEQIINKSFAEGQLDECELTLKNLNEIAKVFTRILLSIYHQRVEYPREALKLHEKDIHVLEDHARREGPPLAGPRKGLPPVHH